MKRLLLFVVALSALTACVMTPAYRTVDGRVRPAEITPIVAPVATYDAPYDSRYGVPYALPVGAERSCRADRSECEFAIHRCWRGEASCVEARHFCQGVQDRCGSFY